jgi:hypothetical protein
VLIHYIVSRWLNARIGELVEQVIGRQTRFHGNAQMQQSGISCWLNPKPYIVSLAVAMIRHTKQHATVERTVFSI